MNAATVFGFPPRFLIEFRRFFIDWSLGFPPQFPTGLEGFSPLDGSLSSSSAHPAELGSWAPQCWLGFSSIDSWFCIHDPWQLKPTAIPLRFDNVPLMSRSTIRPEVLGIKQKPEASKCIKKNWVVISFLCGSGIASPATYRSFGFFLLEVRRFFFHQSSAYPLGLGANITLFLSAPCGARRSSASAIFRVSSAISIKVSEVFSHRFRRLGFSSQRFFQPPFNHSYRYQLYLSTRSSELAS